MGDIKLTPALRLRLWWFRHERDVLRPICIIGWLLVSLFLLSGCATYAVPYTAQPGNYACAFVWWTEEAQIQAYCPHGAEACGTVAHEKNHIWTPKPEAFDDFWRVYKLGHEFLHSLGARHR